MDALSANGASKDEPLAGLGTYGQEQRYGAILPDEEAAVVKKEEAGKGNTEAATTDVVADGPNKMGPGTSTDVTSVGSVVAWLQNLGYPEHAQAFSDNEVNGGILRTLSSEELRDDLGVTRLSHRRDILDAIAKLAGVTERDSLPEHGRILNHLSNVRTYHSWVRVGVQLLAFSIAALRLLPFRTAAFTTAFSFVLALFGTSGLLWGAFRYRTVNSMIERSGTAKHTQTYQPDLLGVFVSLGVTLIVAVMTVVMIVIDGFKGLEVDR